jgi:hypothetical protein
MGSNLSPQKRCESVSPRFQQAYNNGTLSFLTNSKINGQPVICTAREYGDSCHTVLMTLRSQDDSFKILNDLKDILNGRSVGPLIHSSGAPKAYIQLDIEEFLRTQPVEPES